MSKNLEINLNLLSSLLPKRSDNSSKFDFGRALIVSGSRAYTGSVYLAAMASARSGTGLVNVLSPNSAYSILATKFLEVIITPLDEDGDGFIVDNGKNRLTIRRYLDKSSAMLLGPGLGTSNDLKNLLTFLIKNSLIPLVLDADALNNLKGSPETLKDRKDNCLLLLFPLI